MRFLPGKLLLTAVLSSAFLVQPLVADELSEAFEERAGVFGNDAARFSRAGFIPGKKTGQT